MSHDDHGHGHGHHGPDTKTPVVIGAVVIAGLLIGAYALVSAGTKARADGRANFVVKVDPPVNAHAQAGHGQQAHGQQAHGQQAHKAHGHEAHGKKAHAKKAHGHGAHAVPREFAPRAAFVAQFQRRQQAQGFKLTAKTLGPKHDVFVITFTGQAAKGKVEALKKAKPLHDEARSKGFSRLLIREAGKTVLNEAL